MQAHPKGNYILALGDEGTNVAQEEKQGYYKVLKPYLDRGDIKIVSEQFNKNWSTESGRAQVENALTKTNNDVVAVLAGNDGVAYGVIQALQGQGLAGKVWVNGVDAEPRAQALISGRVRSRISNFTDYCQSGQVSGGHCAEKLAKGDSARSPDDLQQRAEGRALVPGRSSERERRITSTNLSKRLPWWFKKSP